MPKDPEKKKKKFETKTAPDLRKELSELSSAQDEKMDAQSKGSKDLERVNKKVAEEAGDILRIAKECSDDPDRFILEAMEDYAKKEGISLLAAKAKVLQYLSPEWKEKVDREVRDYFKNFDLFDDFIELKDGSEELETLKTLCSEGYISYLVIVAHFYGDPDGKGHMIDAFDDFRKGVNKIWEDTNNVGFEDKESVVLESCFPDVKNYLKKLKEKGSREEYEHIIDLTFKYAIWAYLMKKELGDIYDCDENTLLLQRLAMDNGLEIGNYINTRGHAVLRLDGSDLVLDTFDFNIRTIESCARKEGYGPDKTGYFWRSNAEEYLAQYEQGGGYPKKIVGYKKVEKNPVPIVPYGDVAALLWPVAQYLSKRGFPVEAEKCYKRILEINPDVEGTHYNYGGFLYEEGRKDEAFRHWEKAAKLNPHYTNALFNLASSLDTRGKYDEAKVCYEKLLELDPNDPDNFLSYAISRYEDKDYVNARKHLDNFLQITGKHNLRSLSLNAWLKNEGF